MVCRPSHLQHVQLLRPLRSSTSVEVATLVSGLSGVDRSDCCCLAMHSMFHAHGRVTCALAGLRQRSSLTWIWTAWRCVLITSWHCCRLPGEAIWQLNEETPPYMADRARLLRPLAKHRGCLAVCSSKGKENATRVSTCRPSRAAAPRCPLRASWQAHASVCLPHTCAQEQHCTYAAHSAAPQDDPPLQPDGLRTNRVKETKIA